jgi:hypothetical protein
MECDSFYLESLEKQTRYRDLLRKVPDDVFLDELAEDLTVSGLQVVPQLRTDSKQTDDCADPSSDTGSVDYLPGRGCGQEAETNRGANEGARGE